MKKKILILSTGGTIACSESENGLVPTATAEAFLACLPDRMSNDFDISLLDLFQLDSSSVGPAHWLQIAEALRERYDAFDGFLITHGTDTMAYTASALSFLLAGARKPIVITGAQLPADVPGSDGPANLKTSFQAFYTGFTGVMVAFCGQLIRGCRSSKLRTHSFNAFESINVPPLMDFSSNDHGYHPPEPEPAPATAEELFGTEPFAVDSRVGLLKIYPGMPPQMITAMAQLGFRGLVIELFGIGNFPAEDKSLMDALHSLADRDMVIVTKSQCTYEPSDSDIYAAGRQLAALRPISAKDMTTEAAMTKLMWALAKTTNTEQVRQLFQTNISGEISL
ncbi:MAG: asparaginase [Firmicutes bacterium]|nr:asparaginase [Bacillota bacterium]